MPEQWQVRRVLVGTYGRLCVYAVSRSDLIAMKFIAHRERDLEHLAQLRPTWTELAFVRGYLDSLTLAHPEETGRIEMARQYLNEWELGA